MGTVEEPSFKLPTYRGRRDSPCSACGDPCLAGCTPCRVPIHLKCGHFFCFHCLEVAFLEQVTTPDLPRRRCYCPTCNRTFYECTTDPSQVFGLRAKFSARARSMHVFVQLADNSIEHGHQLLPTRSRASRSQCQGHEQSQEQSQQPLPNGDPWPSEDDIFYATARYRLEVEVHGHPITPRPSWFPLVFNVNQRAQ